MNKLILLLCGLLGSQASQALSGKAYMDRFNSYLEYSAKLPTQTTPEFLEFVKGSTPLSNKLREKWLYDLAIKQDWAGFRLYYQPSNDVNLVCYEQVANYYLGAREEAMQASTKLWLTGESMPPSCNKLFDIMMKDSSFSQDLITQRLDLALDKHNIKLANYLFKQYKPAYLAGIQTLNTVYQSPRAISRINPTGLNSYIYLYGLKRMVSNNKMDKALELWQQDKIQKALNQAQHQNFLAHIALYKAMRNSEDTLAWFAKVKPQYYNETLIDWQIRYALKLKDWPRVTALINEAKNKDTPCWQYWLGRSLEEQGKKEEARVIYEPLAKSRQYYGFLASMRLNQTPKFTNEVTNQNLAVLKPYQKLLDQIRALYRTKNVLPASRLLNDFISELPKNEASALVFWVGSSLRWHGKSVHLSNSELLNNELALRFPLAYKDTVKQFAKKYAIPPEFIYAIIRQESSFMEDATSAVGARGLMQLMPYTAGVVSKAGKIRYNNKNQLFLSDKNINIGTAYLRQLAKRFSNHPILIAAAYNAGPKQVVYWLRNHPPKEIDEWVETLPWQETRNYLKNVMAFDVVYQYRLAQKPDLEKFLEPLG